MSGALLGSFVFSLASRPRREQLSHTLTQRAAFWKDGDRVLEGWEFSPESQGWSSFECKISSFQKKTLLGKAKSQQGEQRLGAEGGKVGRLRC